MERCETCRHWQKDEMYYPYLRAVGICAAVTPMGASIRSDRGSWGIKQEYAGRLAFTDEWNDDYVVEQYSSWLVTFAEFGCVQHQDRSAGPLIEEALRRVHPINPPDGNE